MFVVIKSPKEKSLWMVGFHVYADDGTPIWHPVRDFGSLAEAERHINYLNGGNGMLKVDWD
jgi:hypothetical protein